MSAKRIAQLEREIRLLRTFVHTSPTARLAEQLVSEADARSSQKKLRRARKKLLLACHSDKTSGLSSKLLSERFTRAVLELTKEF